MSRPLYIEIEIAYQKIELIEDDLIDVYFRQDYASNLYRDKTSKRLRKSRELEGWKIIEEKSL